MRALHLYSLINQPHIEQSDPGDNLKTRRFQSLSGLLCLSWPSSVAVPLVWNKDENAKRIVSQLNISWKQRKNPETKIKR